NWETLMIHLPWFLRRPRVDSDWVDGPTQTTLAATTRGEDQNLMGRIVKYIPGEVVGLYVALSGIMEGQVMSGRGFGLTLEEWYWLGFWVFLGLSPFWMLLSTARAGKPTQWYQVAVTPFAFFFWALALGGPFKLTLQPPRYTDWVYSPT